MAKMHRPLWLKRLMYRLFGAPYVHGVIESVQVLPTALTSDEILMLMRDEQGEAREGEPQS